MVMKVAPKGAAAVGAPKANESGGHNASDVATKGRNKKNPTDVVVQAGIENLKRAPRIFFMGFRVAVSDGQKEAAMAALKTARAAVTAWTADAWKAEMKIVLEPF